MTAAAALVAALLPAGGAAAQSLDCSVDYDASNDWGSGFTAEVGIANDGSDPIDSWELTWTFPGDQQISNLWNGDWDQSGQEVTVSDMGWNGTIAPGSSASFGFQASYSGANEAPADFAVNGVPCDGDGNGGEEPEHEPPQVELVSPETGSTFDEGEDIALEAEAEGGDAEVEHVEFFAGSESLGIDTSEPYTASWSGAPAGFHTLTATAVDETGAEASDSVNVQVGESELSDYEEAFLEQYERIKDPASGYFREFDGLLVPYHSVETLIVEAPDHGHQTTSEAYSYYLMLEADYGRVTGDWEPFNQAWASMEAFIIPDPEEQSFNTGYDPGDPATYAPEHPSPADYPAELDDGVPVGEDPLAAELSSTYGTDDIYQMHWLLDVANIYEYGHCGDGTDDAPAYINTYQRGQQESVWQTIPHPSCETFEHGGENGFLDLFIGDDDYAQQTRYTSAPDADARAVQVAYWAHTWAEEQGQSEAVADSVSNAAMLGDYLRYAMYDKYFKEIGDCVGAESCPGGSGKDSAHYLLSWYASWGGSAADAEYPWAFRIGGSGVHQGYQNPMAAYALSEVDALQPESPTAVEDWSISLDTQLEFIEWLQAPEGGIAGGATNNWGGHYGEPDSGARFNGMAYDWQPVWNDPPSNNWFGFQVWGMERIAQYYNVTGDERAEGILDDWVSWAVDNTTVGSGGDFAVPATLEWSGEPSDGLSVSVDDHNQDVGVTAGLAKILLYYAERAGDETARSVAEGLMDALLEHETDLGLATAETREDYERFDDPWNPSDMTGTYVPDGWTGTMGNGDPIDSDSTFLSIRSFYEDDPDWPQVAEYLDGGPAPEFVYHRFWAQAEIASTFAAHGELFG